MKVAPTAAYGIQLIWKYLSLANLEALDSVKPSSLKKVLGLHRSGPKRLVYLLAVTPSLIEELRRRFSLEETPAYKEFVGTLKEKCATIDPEFLDTHTMKMSEYKNIIISM